MAALTLGALGVVFGDIGTSPLYALQTVFAAEHHLVEPSRVNVYGVVSLVFWAITLIVSIKFVTFIMRADNHGEGGIMALVALLRSVPLSRRARRGVLVTLGIFGAALFYGDGMITPAISVLSAVEGLKIAAPDLASLVAPITLVVLGVLFGIQRYGTGVIGRLFGPVMAVWFGVLALAGLAEVARHPGILRALSPSYAVAFFAEHGGIAFLSLASVVLAVTGAEALYADMGHFGRSPIRRAWFWVVFPALTLNYMGQGSLVLRTPRAIDNPFFLLVPHWGRVPMVLLATLATIIASQAVISGAFSLTRQAVQLGFLPRVSVHHTSDAEEGRVYVPAVNWGLFAAVVVLVLGFESSARLASAYGIAVTGTLTIDSILFLVVMRALWHRPRWQVAAGAVVFLTVDLAFLAANLTKIVHGGWFPLSIALAVFTVLITWYRGRRIVTARRLEEEGSLEALVDEIQTMEPPVLRAPGTAVFLSMNPATAPLALRANVHHNHVLHRKVVIVALETQTVPRVAPSDALAVAQLGRRPGELTRLTVRVGFMDSPNVPGLLRLARDRGLEPDLDLDALSYFVSRIRIIRTDAPGMSAWRKRLFMLLAENAATPIDHFGLPDDRTVIVGSRVAL